MVTEESTKDTVKTIAQGRPDDPPVPVVLPRAFLLHADRGWCAEYERQLGGGSPLSSLMAAKD